MESLEEKGKRPRAAKEHSCGRSHQRKAHRHGAQRPGCPPAIALQSRPPSPYQPALAGLPPWALSEVRAIWQRARTCKAFFPSSSHTALWKFLFLSHLPSSPSLMPNLPVSLLMHHHQSGCRTPLQHKGYKGRSTPALLPSTCTCSQKGAVDAPALRKHVWPKACVWEST